MKKRLKKITSFNYIKKQKTSSKPESPTRVTNDSISRHREEILNKAKRFKYPLNRSKHRVALVSVGVVLAALAALSVGTGLQLYRWQSTGNFTYRVTSILPFPVARISGSFVSYESYLFELTSSLHWQERYGTTDLHSPDGKRQIEFLKRSALDKALINATAHKLAKKHNITVAAEEVEEIVERIRSGGGDLNQILGENFNFTESELRRYIKDNILRQRVAHELDKDAPSRAKKVLSKIRGGMSFADAATSFSEDEETSQAAGDIGVVEKGRSGLPEKVTNAIFNLKPGETSDVIETSTDYFIVNVTSREGKDKAKASIIRIKIRDISEYLKEYRESDQVQEYIKLDGDSAEDQL